MGHSHCIPERFFGSRQRVELGDGAQGPISLSTSEPIGLKRKFSTAMKDAGPMAPQRNDDGSVDIYFGSDVPRGKERSHARRWRVRITVPLLWPDEAAL